MSGFSLETSWSERTIQDPTHADLNQAIERMSAKGDFIILGRAKGHFIQAAPWVLEYREENRQFQCELPDFDREAIKRSMTAYLQGQDFRLGLAWTEITTEVQWSRTRSALIIIVAICLAIAFVIWTYVRSL